PAEEISGCFPASYGQRGRPYLRENELSVVATCSQQQPGRGVSYSRCCPFCRPGRSAGAGSDQPRDTPAPSAGASCAHSQPAGASPATCAAWAWSAASTSTDGPAPDTMAGRPAALSCST